MERYEKSVIRLMDRQITKKFSKKKFYKVHLQESLLESINNYGLLIFQLQKSVSCPSRHHFSRLSMRGNSLRSSRPANSMDQDSFDSFDDIEEMVMATTSMSIGHNGHSDANRFVKTKNPKFESSRTNPDFFPIFRDSLNTGEHEHDELPKSIIVTNVDLSVFDNIDIKVINKLIGLRPSLHWEY